MTTELNSARSLSTFLSQVGVTLHAQRLLELSGGAISVRFVTRVLRDQGEATRGVHVRADDLARLRTPTLLALHSGEICILAGVDGRHATLQHGGGQIEELPLQKLADRVQTAFERGPRVLTGGTFLPTLFNVLGQATGSLLFVFLVSLAIVGVGLFTPWLTRQVMSHALGERAPSLLTTLVCALVAASLLRVWLVWLRARGQLAIEAQLVHASGQFLFRRIGALPYQEHQKRGFGNLLQVLGSAEALTRALAGIGVAPVVEALGALAYLLVLVSASPFVAVVLLFLAGVTTLGTLLFSRRYVRLQSEELNESARARARLHELLTGIATIKAEHAQRPAMLRWLEGLVGERGIALSKELTEAWLSLFLGAIDRVGRLFVLGWAAFAVIEQQVDVATLVYVGMLSEGFLFSATNLARTLTLIWSARTHLARVDGLLAVEPLSLSNAGQNTSYVGDGPAIQMSDVWFRHGPDKPWILQGYSLSVARGEHLDLRGPSGMGKTTILRLIAGLYRPERGTVAVLGKDPWQDQAHIAYLPQHAQLLSGSLRDNLTHLSGARLERLASACATTHISSWIRTLPMGLDTVVAAGGANLSGGQRQWVVLTAAVASERPVLLMDESMSQMDHLVRSELCLERLFAGKTTVRVTHDV